MPPSHNSFGDDPLPKGTIAYATRGEQATGSMGNGYQLLTEKEKQTLRLLLAGHDAKSMAQHLGLSVHTVNERLRDARRKLSVSSSKAAARLVRQSECADPETIGDRPFGDAGADLDGQQSKEPVTGKRVKRSAAWAIGGLAMISIFAAMLAFSTPAQGPDAPANFPSAVTARLPVAESSVTRAARDWLALVDQGQWNESWAATTQSFQSLNSVAAWQSASEKARVPLGRVVTRQLLSDNSVPAPPNGIRVIRFHTDFANKRGAIETVSLDREGDIWKVVGCYIE